eukprot:3357259-Amphidinium_carterae.1
MDTDKVMHEATWRDAQRNPLYIRPPITWIKTFVDGGLTRSARWYQGREPAYDTGLRRCEGEQVPGQFKVMAGAGPPPPRGGGGGS